MFADFKSVHRPRRAGGCDLSCFSRANAEQVRRFHATFPVYSETPLISFPYLARELGLGELYVKDESKRFALNAFKVLGGSYAIGRELARRLDMAPEEMSYAALTTPAARKRTGELTFVTATDGNHGRGVAWTARVLGHKSVVYMPAGSTSERLENIRAEGAEASVTQYNYDDAVRLASRMADQQGWIVVQDTAWQGYEDVPIHIMQGYATMALEADDQLPQPPTHIFLQAGVGSMAAAVLGFFARAYGAKRPVVTIVEPNEADCIFRTASADDGDIHTVTGSMETIMAGLACGEPNPLAWNILRDYADHYVSCPDWVAAQGMRLLGNPAADRDRVISGESGAVTAGLVKELMTRPELAALKEAIGLNSASRVLCFSTEGDTDRNHYRKIVWSGRCAAPY